MVWALLAGWSAAADTPARNGVGGAAVEEHESHRAAPRFVAWPAPDRAHGVVNGEVVTRGHDEVVALAGMDPNTGGAEVFCSGSLITGTWVLTAAHCIDGSRMVSSAGLDLVVLFGEDLRNDGYVEAIPWVQGIEDPSYNPSQFVNDAGLVELEWAREDTRWMVLRDEPLDDAFVGTELTFFGFGVTRDNGTDSGIKRTTRIPVAGFDAYNIDTYDPETNLCSGDSGGPSTFEGSKGPEQVGINAFVENACVGGRTGSTRVDNHVAWIQSYVPDVALDWDDLPRPDLPGGGVGGWDGRPWGDLGADEAHGLGGRWEDGAPVARGCATDGGAGGLGWALAAWGLGLRRKRRPARA